MKLGPPYTDVRIEVPPMMTIYDLRSMPGLMSVNLWPPASGPEIELTFGTAMGSDPVAEDHLRNEVERITERPVLAIRRRGAETADPHKFSPLRPWDLRSGGRCKHCLAPMSAHPMHCEVRARPEGDKRPAELSFNALSAT